MLQRLNAPGAFHDAPYCHACVAGDFLYVTGQVSIDPATGEYVLGDIEVETRRVMDNLKIVLDHASFRADQVVSARAFLTDFDNDYETFNRIYTEYMGDHLPTRTTIGVTKLAAGARVEVDLVAYKG